MNHLKKKLKAALIHIVFHVTQMYPSIGAIFMTLLYGERFVHCTKILTVHVVIHDGGPQNGSSFFGLDCQIINVGEICSAFRVFFHIIQIYVKC